MLYNKSLLVIYFTFLFNFIFKILAALDLRCGGRALCHSVQASPAVVHGLQRAGFCSCGIWA